MPNKNNYGKNADWKRSSARTSRTPNRSETNRTNREQANSRPSSYLHAPATSRPSSLSRKPISGQLLKTKKRKVPSLKKGTTPKSTDLLQKRFSSASHNSPFVIRADFRNRTGTSGTRNTHHRRIKDPREQPAVLVGRALTELPDARHRRMGKVIVSSTTASNNTSNASSIAGTANPAWVDVATGGQADVASTLSNSSSAALQPDLCEQRAIVAATRAVWAIADTAEQVANMHNSRQSSATTREVHPPASDVANPHSCMPVTSISPESSSLGDQSSIGWFNMSASPPYRFGSRPLSRASRSISRPSSRSVSRAGSRQGSRPGSGSRKSSQNRVIPTRSDAAPP